jgi:hypothetical protein
VINAKIRVCMVCHRNSEEGTTDNLVIRKISGKGDIYIGFWESLLYESHIFAHLKRNNENTEIAHLKLRYNQLFPDCSLR